MVTDGQVQTLTNWLGTGTINIFGLPFSGKDTQCQKLADLFDAAIIGGGEIIRRSQHEDVKQIVNKGKLAPTQAYLDIILPYFKKAEYVGKPLILSSVGRWHGEEMGVIAALKASGHELKAVVLLALSEDEAKKRYYAALNSGDRGKRADDEHGKLEVRLGEFRNKTQPVIDFYRKQNLLIEVDGSLPPEEVTKEILTKLEKLANLS